MKLLKVVIDGKRLDVSRGDYVTAKTAQLQEFGYPGLTEQEVDKQITALLEKKEFGKGLTVIGMFMEGEVVV